MPSSFCGEGVLEVWVLYHLPNRIKYISFLPDTSYYLLERQMVVLQGSVLRKTVRKNQVASFPVHPLLSSDTPLPLQALHEAALEKLPSRGQG